MMQLIMFTKHLQEFPVAETARRVKALGFDGLDLTVRPGGHVLPERVGTDLPRAVAEAKDAGLAVPLISTAITGAGTPHAEATLAAAAHADVRTLKLGYWNIPRGGSLLRAIDEARRELDGLEKLAATYHVTLGVHNHSGPGYVNCQPAVIWMLLRDRDPDRIAAYFDPGHAAVEGGNGGWRQALELLAPHIRLVAIKDLAWKAEPGKPKTAWHDQMVPLRDGIVPWPEFFERLARTTFNGPISLHSEYQGKHSWRDLTTAELIDQTAVDLAFVKAMLAAHPIG
jgi:sugar phosphate isomerase/epimerase